MMHGQQNPVNSAEPSSSEQSWDCNVDLEVSCTILQLLPEAAAGLCGMTQRMMHCAQHVIKETTLPHGAFDQGLSRLFWNLTNCA